MQKQLALTALIAATPLAQAQLIEITGSGQVEDNTGITVAFQGQSITFRIVVDPSVPPAPREPGDPIAEFLGAVVSFTIDGFEVPINGVSEVTYRRSASRDVLDIDAGAGTPYEADFEARLPLGYFGQEPFSLDTLASLTFGDITNVPSVDLFNSATGAEADADIFALSVRVIGPPCPADLAEPFGTLNFFDISAFIGLFNAGDPTADVAAPFGSLNFFDVAEYIARFNAGCP